MMITSFDDFVLWMYVVIDDLWQQVTPYDRRPGPAPRCSDSELLTLILVGECRGWHTETTLLQHWQEHRDLFPILPERSRLNRRRRQLTGALNRVRQLVLTVLDLALDRQCALDSLPVPVIQFHLVPRSPAAASWRAAGARFGWVASKRQRFFGYKLQLLITLNGVILDVVLAAANTDERAAGRELLAAHHDLTVVADKGYVSAPLTAELWEQQAIRLLTVPRRNQKRQLAKTKARLQNRWRQRIETVVDQLSEQFAIEHIKVRTFAGLCARLTSKLTAHTLCIYLNRLLGNPDHLQIKHLAFPY